MRLLAPHGARNDVALRPAATAKVWLGVDQPHETVAVPGVGLSQGDVLVAIELSTIGAADRQIVAGERTAPVPLILGYESVGRVLAIGEGGAHATDGTDIRIGDRVVWSVTVSCGTCEQCSAGRTQMCTTLQKYGQVRIAPRWELTGGFATHAHLRAGTAIARVPEILPAAVLAPASCTAATAWAAVSRAAAGRDLEGVRVLVFGAGLTGLSAAAIAADAGASVTVVDPNPERRAFAQRFGGIAVTSATKPSDIVIETSGRAATEAIAAAADGGTVVLIGGGTHPVPVELDAEDTARRLLTITGVHDCTARDLGDAVGFLASGGRAFPFADAVGAVYPLEEVDAAISAAAEPDAPLRVAVNPR